jgi:hypothetical protein
MLHHSLRSFTIDTKTLVYNKHKLSGNCQIIELKMLHHIDTKTLFHKKTQVVRGMGNDLHLSSNKIMQVIKRV